jgi:hypothetical protein
MDRLLDFNRKNQRTFLPSLFPGSAELVLVWRSFPTKAVVHKAQWMS